MKTINSYIIEKSNFLVRKHVNHSNSFESELDYKKLRKDDFIKIVYANDDLSKRQMLIGKVLSNEDERIYLQYFVGNMYSVKTRKHIKTGGSFAYVDFENDYELKTFTDDEINLVNEMDEEIHAKKCKLPSQPTVNSGNIIGVITVDEKIKIGEQ